MAKRSVIIQLPESDTLQSAKLSSSDLEELVKAMLGSQAGRGIDNVILKGGQTSGPGNAAIDWTKTIWSRAC